VLLAKLSIFNFFFIDRLLRLSKHVKVDLTDRLSAFDSLLEVLVSSFLLEFFNLGPDGIGNILVSC
jgi:hypothetical protein